MRLNTIYNEDCLEGMKRIPDCSIDMILCDLPYGTTACSWDEIIPFEPMWEQFERVIKENGAIVLTASQPFTTKLIMSNLSWFKYNWVWEKPQGVDPFMSKYRPLNNVEDVVVFYKKQPTYNPQLERGEPYEITRDKKERDYEVTNTVMRETTTINEGTRLPKRIIKINQERGLHPTQKPVELFEYLIKTYTNKGETVLDATMGSGTTAIACLNTDRQYIGFELDEEYHKMSLERIKNHTQQLDLI